MPRVVSQQLMPPPETGGQVSWHCASVAQLEHIMAPLLLPLPPPLPLPLPPPLLPPLPPLLDPLGQDAPGAT